MKAGFFRVAAVVSLVIAGTGLCDTFRNKQTGEIFHGFATQKTTRTGTLVFNSESNKFESLNLADFEAAIDSQGRKNNVSLISITDEEVMLSESISQEVANSIIEASNAGPRFIIVQIDSPGGRGKPMTTICDAIVKTQNCPVAAYIGGGRYNGAYSAATTIAFACRKIYIDANASVGPVAATTAGTTNKTGRRRKKDQDKSAVTTEQFNPSELRGYGSYAAAVARNNNRPWVFAEAFLDPSVEVVEVVDTAGKKWFVDQKSRKPSETVVHRWTTSSGGSTTGGKPSSTAGTAFPAGTTSWLITAGEAVSIGLADKKVESPAGILADMGAADAVIVRSKGIDSKTRQFDVTKRRAAETLRNINQLEQRAGQLENNFNQIEQQNKNNPFIQQYNRMQSLYPPNSRNRQQDRVWYDGPQMFIGKDRPLMRRNLQYEENAALVQEASAALWGAAQELAVTLDQLMGQYTQASAMLKKWPDAFESDVTEEGFQNKLNEAMTKKNNLIMKMTPAPTPYYGKQGIRK